MARALARGLALAGWLGVLAGLAAGCDKERDLGVSGATSQNGIVVESLKVEQIHDGFQDRCRVFGTIRNETGAGQRVTLVFEAFNGDGDSIASAVATVDFVDAGKRANYEARFRNFSDDGFLNDCDRIAHVELHEVIL